MATKNYNPTTSTPLLVENLISNIAEMEYQNHTLYLASESKYKNSSPTADPHFQKSPTKVPSKLSKIFYYRIFFNHFELLEIEDSAFAHFSLMLRTVNNRIAAGKEGICPERFKMLVAATFFISLKYMMDDYSIYLVDFARMGKVDPEVLEEAELYLLVELLKGDIHYDERSYLRELDRLLH